MEGVGEKLFDMSKDTITITAAQFLTNAIIDGWRKTKCFISSYETTNYRTLRNVINGGNGYNRWWRNLVQR